MDDSVRRDANASVVNCGPHSKELNAIYCKYKPDLSLPSSLISGHGLSLAQRTKSLSSTQVFWGFCINSVQQT